MLEGIELIDWSKREHAFGPAADLPQLLRDVACGGPAADQAVSELFGTIWHQGTVYDATSEAVPFLGELAASGDVDIEVRFLLLALIFAIGRGKGYWQVHADTAAELGCEPDGLPALLNAEGESVRACRQAVQRVADEFIENLATWPDRLWPSVAVLVVVAGEAGRASLDGIVMEATRRLPPFGAAGIATIAELIADGSTSPSREGTLTALDGDLADFVAQECRSGDFELSLDSYFVDVLVERICDSGGEGQRL